MAHGIDSRSLKALVDAGVVPDRCRNLELIIQASGALVLRYEILVTAEDIGKLSKAFAAIDDTLVRGGVT